MARSKQQVDRALPPDQAQRDLILQELDRNMLVEAAAGTGKTTCLVGRMINLIKEGKCSVDHLAAVTYTRKAAAELRARFQVALEKEARAAKGSRQDRLRAAVNHVHRCFLGTIHSFCGRVLRERPVEAGVDAAFTELDEETDHLLRRQAWGQYVARLIACDHPILAELASVGLEIRQLEPTFYDFAGYPDVTDWPAPDVQKPELSPVLNALQTYCTQMQELAKKLPVDPGRDQLMPQYRRVPQSIRHRNLERVGELLEVLEAFKELPKGAVVQRNWPEGKGQALAELDRWNDFAQTHAIPFVAAWRMIRYGPALRALKGAVADYEALRRKAGGLNFQDLLLKAAELLRRQPQVRNYFRRRFTHLLIDEFQDTDPIQAEVMFLLTADDPTQANWRLCRPVRGSLFVVGDPKQSIYRFRRADIVTYKEVKRLIEASDGMVVPLTANFRATRPLVDWVNETFAERFPPTETEVAPGRCPLEVGRVGDHAGDLAGIYQITVPGTTEEGHEYEATLLAGTIRQALDARRTVPRSQKEVQRGDQETAQPGDFLIITRNRRHLSFFARKLEGLGVPHQVTGGTALNEMEELELLFTCLRAVTRPDDPIALVAALRSELFGISDTALFAFKQAQGRYSFPAAVPAEGLAADDAAALTDAFERLRSYDVWLKTLPPAAAFARVAGDLGLPARAAMEAGGDVRAGCLAKTLELVRAAQAEMLAVTDLVDFLGQLVNKQARYDGISVRSHAAPVVRLMNLHQAKGLEAPVVFLADPSGDSDHDVELHIDRSGAQVRGYLAAYGPNRGFGRGPLLACPADWERLVEKEKAFQDAENERLMYVAATRAGTSITIAQREKSNYRNPWKSFADRLKGCPNLADPGPQQGPTTSRITVTLNDVANAGTGISERWSAARKPTYGAEAIKEIALVGAAPTVERPETPAGEHGVEWGTVIHSLLENAMRQPNADLHHLARSFLRELGANAELAEVAVEAVQKVQASALWQRALASQKRVVEIPLQVLVPAAEAGDGIAKVRSGVIDLAFLEKGGWVIVDYKTDNVASQHLQRLVDHYRPQVKSYADVWQKLVPQPVTEVGLFFTRTNSYVRV
jgi:ATP-dependent helicase/nuclease subunit A